MYQPLFNTSSNTRWYSSKKTWLDLPRFSYSIVGIRFKDIIIWIEMLRGKHHQYGIFGKIIHNMPVLWFKHQAFIRAVKNVFLLGSTVVIPDMTGTLDGDGGLDGFMMPMAAPDGFVHAIDIKDTPDIKGYCFFNNSE